MGCINKGCRQEDLTSSLVNMNAVVKYNLYHSLSHCVVFVRCWWTPRLDLSVLGWTL